MISKYEIGDTVLLPAKIVGIEQYPDGKIAYKIREYEIPVSEHYIIARIEEPWELNKTDD